MDNKPALQSSLAPCRYPFLFRDTVIITAGVATFCCVSYKKTSMSPWAIWKFTPFFTPSDRPQTAVLGLLQRGFRCSEESSGISECNAVLEGDTGSPDLEVLGLKHCIPGDMSRLNPGKQVRTICWVSPHQKCAPLSYLPNAAYGL